MLMAQFRIASLWWWMVDGLQKNSQGVKNRTFGRMLTGTRQVFGVWRSEGESENWRGQSRANGGGGLLRRAQIEV